MFAHKFYNSFTNSDDASRWLACLRKLGRKKLFFPHFLFKRYSLVFFSYSSGRRDPKWLGQIKSVGKTNVFVW